MTLFLIVIAMLSLLLVAGWYATHEGSPVIEDRPLEKTPIGDQLALDMGLLEQMSLPELLEYLKKRQEVTK